MSSSQNLNKCHKIKVKNCKGTFVDERIEYDEWAYWCAKLKGGWRSSPCNCPKNIRKGV